MLQALSLGESIYWKFNIMLYLVLSLLWSWLSLEARVSHLNKFFINCSLKFDGKAKKINDLASLRLMS